MIGDPSVLFSDLLDNPEKYEEGVDALLQQLVHGQKKPEDLSAQEQQLLSSAVVTFVQAPRKKVTPPEPVRAKHAPVEEPDLDESGAPIPTEIELPDAPSFWWQR